MFEQKETIRDTPNLWTALKLQPKANGSTISENEVDLAEAQENTLSQDEEVIRRDQLDELMITNPSLYEQLVLNGSLEDEETLPDGNDL